MQFSISSGDCSICPGNSLFVTLLAYLWLEVCKFIVLSSSNFEYHVIAAACTCYSINVGNWLDEGSLVACIVGLEEITLGKIFLMHNLSIFFNNNSFDYSKDNIVVNKTHYAFRIKYNRLSFGMQYY